MSLNEKVYFCSPPNFFFQKVIVWERFLYRNLSVAYCVVNTKQFLFGRNAIYSHQAAISNFVFRYVQYLFKPYDTLYFPMLYGVKRRKDDILL